MINTAVRRGEYPQLYKYEICTPVPKCYPPRSTSDMRSISGLLTFDKIMEKLISDLIISDMKHKFDPSQYVNQKGVSTQHYLIGMIHRILTAREFCRGGEFYRLEQRISAAGSKTWSRVFHEEWCTAGANPRTNQLFSRPRNEGKVAWLPICSAKTGGRWPSRCHARIIRIFVSIKQQC